jgi:hypothetical protein
MLCFAVALLLAAAVVAAQTTPAPATSGSTTLTQPERDKALASLQATHDKFLQSISGLSEKQWKFKAAPDRWSVAEVAEHITVAESGIFGLVQQKVMPGPATPDKRASVAGKDDIILTKMIDRSVKAKAPEFLQPTGRFANHDDLVKAFEQARGNTMSYVRTTSDDLRDHFFDHPVFGTLDAYQWILLISAHSARHTEQIEEVKADPNFPKE